MKRSHMKAGIYVAAAVAACLLAGVLSTGAAEFTKEDLARWEKEFQSVVMEGERFFHSADLGKNKVSCDQCHPNGANTHPETYPKFQRQIGRVVTLFEMVNWCLQNPLEGEALAADNPKMVALLAYIAYERRGVPLAPGKP